MLKHFLSSYTRISFYNNKRRFAFPLEVGKIIINDKKYFELSYDRIRTNKEYQKDFLYSIEHLKHTSTIQAYTLEKGLVTIKLPYVYNKTIEVKNNNDVLCVLWEEHSDFVNNIKIYSQEEAKEQKTN